MDKKYSLYKVFAVDSRGYIIFDHDIKHRIFTDNIDDIEKLFHINIISNIFEYFRKSLKRNPKSSISKNDTNKFKGNKEKDINHHQIQ